ncbi:MAG: glycosyltransferase family 9 protein [Pseudobdellovibrionaceae bacterium]
MIQARNKILIIRFSSFGDVTQALSIPSKLAELAGPESKGAEIHWVTRQDLAPLLEGHPHLTRIWELNRRDGLKGLMLLICELKKQRFTHIYDAHNNLRSHLISWLLQPPWAVTRLFDPPLFVRKSQKRWKRFLLFRFRRNTFEMPFSGQRDLLEPLQAWGLSRELPPAPQIFVQSEALEKLKTLTRHKDFHSYLTLAPSAAYPLKRWPLAHFKKLVELLPQEQFVCLGGPEDRFIEEIVGVAPERVLNLAGLLTLQESTAAISLSRGLITNDTGLLHVGEQLGKKTIALMGPAPFGFPSRSSTKIMELDLKCRPCSKHGQGPCINEKFHRCLVDITPEQVKKMADQWF